MEFTFSYYYPFTATTIRRRPWWAIWRHDEIVTQKTMARHVVANMPEDEAAFLRSLDWSSANGRAIRKILPVGSDMLQLELGQPASQYIPGGLIKSYGSSNMISRSDWQSDPQNLANH
jgi:hypothetical protein